MFFSDGGSSQIHCLRMGATRPNQKALSLANRSHMVPWKKNK
jgi:hypothetical protein